MSPFEVHVSNEFGKKLFTVEVEANKGEYGKDEAVKASEFGENIDHGLHLSLMLHSFTGEEKVGTKHDLLVFLLISLKVGSNVEHI